MSSWKPKFACLLVSLLVAVSALARADYSGADSWTEGKIVFMSERDGNREIYVMNPDGSDQQRVTFTPDFSEAGPRWSPDGRELAFSGAVPGETRDIYIMNADGSDVRNLTATPGIHEEYPDWSPDGSKIVFIRDEGPGPHIVVAYADGSGEQPVTSGSGDNRPCWSPDGTKIAFAKGMTWGEPISHWQIHVMDADGSNVQRLTYNNEDDTTPRWSPDGTKIVFKSTREGNWWREQLWIMNADGLGQQRLTYSTYRYRNAAWSPDGRYIVCTKAPYNTTNTSIWAMHFDPNTNQVSNEVLLVSTPGARDTGPDWWSPESPGVVEVEIDIKPGSSPNSINLGSQGVVPVAILSSADFDATQVDPDTVTLAAASVAIRGKGNRLMAHEEDVNEDGLMDLVVQVETENLQPDQFQDGYAYLMAQTYDGVEIEGSDEVTLVPLD